MSFQYNKIHAYSVSWYNSRISQNFLQNIHNIQPITLANNEEEWDRVSICLRSSEAYMHQ